jgi:8-oxo-dGTP diphosphatase
VEKAVFRYPGGEAEDMTAPEYRNPFPTVDLIIEVSGPRGQRGIVLIKRKNPPFGWALPGGFVDYGETLEDAARREAREETSLEVELIRQFHSYSDPARDPRKHTISTVFIARGSGTPRARDDAKEARVFGRATIPDLLAFDHRKILDDYFATLKEDPMDETKDHPPEKEERGDLKEVVRVFGPAEAEVVKNFLESQGVACLIRGQVPRFIYPVAVDGMAEFKVLVADKDLELARELLKKLPESEEPEK